MKKLITGLAFASLSLPLMADEVTLPASTQLSITSVKQLRLAEGESDSNAWFAVDPTLIPGHASKQLSNCVLTARVSLERGELLFSSRNLRCPSYTGDVYTAEEISVQLETPTSQVCTLPGSRCKEVTLDTSSEYRVRVNQPATMKAAFNPSREVNRLRIEEQQRNSDHSDN